MNLFSFKRKETSIENALRHLFSDSFIEEITSNNDPENYIDRAIAEGANCELRDLLRAVAELMDLDYCYNLKIPANTLIKRVGYSSKELEDLCVIPQQTPFSYQLVVANPEIIDVNAYRDIGINISLSARSIIRQAWAQYRAIERAHANLPNEQEAIKALAKLSLYAHNLGAKEVIIGVPNQHYYEFSVKEKVYRGKLEIKIIKKLEGMINSTPSRWNIKNKKLSSISIGKLNYNGPSCYFLSWKDSKSLLTKEIEKPKSIIEKTSIRANKTKETIINKNPITVNKNIWLVDDDPQFSSLAAKIVESHSYSCTVFSNGEHICSSLANNTQLPGAIICDLHMPGVDGAEIITRIREYAPLVPILILTSDEDPQTETKLVNCGVDAFIKKSESPSILMAWVKNRLAKDSAKDRYTLKTAAA